MRLTTIIRLLGGCWAASVGVLIANAYVATFAPLQTHVWTYLGAGVAGFLLFQTVLPPPRRAPRSAMPSGHRDPGEPAAWRTAEERGYMRARRLKEPLTAEQLRHMRVQLARRRCAEDL